MNRFLCCSLLLAMTPVAHAMHRHESWNSVKKIVSGSEIEVRITGHADADVERCTMIAADDSSLTCERQRDPNASWTPGAGARLVFPRDSILEVAYWSYSDSHPWIAATVGFVIGAALCAAGGALAALYCGAVGALIGFVMDAVSAWLRTVQPVWIPASSSPPGRWRRKLIYKAPSVAAVLAPAAS